MRKTLIALLTLAALSITPTAHAKASGLIVTAGDSLVQGVGAPAGQSWPDVLDTTCGSSCTVANVGHGGSCIVFTGCGYGETLLSSFDREVLARKPKSTIVAIGRNDLCHVSTDTIIDSYLRLRGRARNAGVNIYFGTITPAGQAWPWPCEAQRIEVNNRLRQMPNVIDFEKLTITPNGFLRSAYDSGDGLHLNADGYAALGRAAAAAVS